MEITNKKKTEVIIYRSGEIIIDFRQKLWNVYNSDEYFVCDDERKYLKECEQIQLIIYGISLLKVFEN